MHHKKACRFPTLTGTGGESQCMGGTVSKGPPKNEQRGEGKSPLREARHNLKRDRGRQRCDDW